MRTLHGRDDNISYPCLISWRPLHPWLAHASSDICPSIRRQFYQSSPPHGSQIRAVDRDQPYAGSRNFHCSKGSNMAWGVGRSPNLLAGLEAGESAGFIGAIVGAIIILTAWGLIAPRLGRT